MDFRYAHPDITHLWSPAWQYGAWHMIETTVLSNQRELGIVPRTDETYALKEDMVLRAPNFEDGQAVPVVQGIELRTKHDVAAFLEYVRSWHGKERGRWIHFGLTSSDVVDTAQGLRFKAARAIFQREASTLVSELTRWTLEDTPVVGRTHGQVAEPASIGTRAYHWLANLERPLFYLMEFSREMQVAKLSGPVGTFAHNPPALEQDVATDLGLKPMGRGASQIVPRSTLGLWASSAGAFAAACAKIAMDVRLMDLTGEAVKRAEPGQVGSSSMAHKRNPIGAEQVAGLARMAQGYAAMLQPMDLWLERDISHSSVERVAVPDLWHTVLRIAEQTAKLLADLVVVNLPIPADALVHARTLDLIRSGLKVDAAREAALAGRSDNVADYPADWFIRNYPYSSVPGSGIR